MKNKIRTLAMYLPQFHRIKENDVWWGDGYTEWTAVRKARPLFTGHNQPRVPLDGRYYNLLDKETMEWQAKTAKKYGISGFCFYHYWFMDHRKILEKPAENLLQWKDVDMPFCFAWDSGQWARTWTKMGNAWADAFEPHKSVKNDNGILLEQKYGDESYWRKHFDYLLPFFRDQRYIKLDGKPVFIFYNSMAIPCFQRMVATWRNWICEAGFPGFYIIAFHVPDTCADAVILPMAFNPATLGYNSGVEHYFRDTSLKVYDYDAVWKDYLRYMPSQENQTLWLCTVDFDDTPRRGLNGRFYLGASPNKFGKYFSQLMNKSIQMNNPFIFIDAWNEWGEGKYLEPDTTYAYQYLEKVQSVVCRGKNYPPQLVTRENNIWKEQAKKLEIQYLKKMADNRLISAWLKIRHNRKAIAAYLRQCGDNSIAIYGCGMYGKMLYDDLQDTQIQVRYFVDVGKAGMKPFGPFAIYSPQENLPICDVMIVSVHREFYAIYQAMSNKVNMPVISLYEVLYEAEKIFVNDKKNQIS